MAQARSSASRVTRTERISWSPRSIDPGHPESPPRAPLADASSTPARPGPRPPSPQIVSTDPFAAGYLPSSFRKIPLRLISPRPSVRLRPLRAADYDELYAIWKKAEGVGPNASASREAAGRGKVLGRGLPRETQQGGHPQVQPVSLRQQQTGQSILETPGLERPFRPSARAAWDGENPRLLPHELLKCATAGLGTAGRDR